MLAFQTVASSGTQKPGLCSEYPLKILHTQKDTSIIGPAICNPPLHACMTNFIEMFTSYMYVAIE